MSAPMTATLNSLPYCLRHGNQRDALAHAVALTSFLQISVEAFQHLDSTPSQEAYDGMDLCFNLLRDKIEIGGGAYLFPTYDFMEDAPPTVPEGGLVAMTPSGHYSTPKRKALLKELRFHARRMNALFREANRSGIMVEVGIDSVKGYDIGTYYCPPEAGELYTKDFAVCDRTANISVWASRKPQEKEMPA